MYGGRVLRTDCVGWCWCAVLRRPSPLACSIAGSRMYVVKLYLGFRTPDCLFWGGLQGTTRSNLLTYWCKMIMVLGFRILQ